MTTHPSRTLAAAAVAATGLLLAACSSSGPPTRANAADGNTHSTAIIDATRLPPPRPAPRAAPFRQFPAPQPAPARWSPSSS
jgi:hypothetical protein